MRTPPSSLAVSTLDVQAQEGMPPREALTEVMKVGEVCEGMTMQIGLLARE